MKKVNKLILRISLILSLVFIVNTSYSQVLITLIFGDKLNSEKLEFGLDGGFNFSNISGYSESKYLLGWNLGFYFDFRIGERSQIHTGVLVKSRMGVHSLDPYPSGDHDLDSIMADNGHVDRVLNYFNVPVTYKYTVYKQWFMEGGIMLGLLAKGTDKFISTTKAGDKLTVDKIITDQVKRIDAGLLVGTGVKLKKKLGMSLGIRYYYGLMNIYKESDGTNHRNSNIYLFASIPIGRGKALEKNEAKESTK